MVYEEEWAQIRKFFEIDFEIAVTRGKTDGVTLVSDPPVCEGCVTARQEMEEQVIFLLSI